MLLGEYDSGVTTKIAVSLPDELVADAKRAVANGRAASVSAYVADALRSYGHEDSLEKFLHDMNATYGPPGPEAEAWATRAMRPVDEV